MSAYKSFPFGQPLSPFRGNGEMLSPRFRIPSGTSGPNGGIGVLGWNFSGAGFFGQYTGKSNQNLVPVGNICGSEVYRKFDAYATYGHHVGTVGYSGYHAAGSVRWDSHQTRDYVFDSAPNRVGVVATGYSTGGLTGNATSATHADIWDTDEDGQPIKVGQVDLSLPVNLSYLDGHLGDWMSRSLEYRQGAYAFAGSHYAAATNATRSETVSGSGARVSGIHLRYGADISADIHPWWDENEVTVYGYAQPFAAKVAIVRRQNAPVVWNTQAGQYISADGAGIYRQGAISEELKGAISSKKWRDSHGTYDRSSSSALASVGHDSSGYDLSKILPPYASDENVTALATFLSADGGAYRITVEARWHLPDDAGTLGTQTLTRELSLGSPVTLSHTTFSPPADSYDRSLSVTQVEEKNAAGEYTVLTAAASWQPLVSIGPDLGARVLAVTKVRHGYRWGHREWGVGTAFPATYDDADDIPYYRTLQSIVALTASSSASAVPSGLPPGYTYLTCGSSITGTYDLDVEQSHDPDTGLLQPEIVNTWAAVLNGRDWTPEKYTAVTLPASVSDIDTATLKTRNFTSALWSSNCFLTYDAPNPNGKIIDETTITLVIPNTTTADEIDWGAEVRVTNDVAGTTVFFEHFAYVPGES